MESSSLLDSIFPIIFIGFIVFWLYIFFSKKGRGSAIKLVTSAKEIKQIGEIAQDDFKTKIGIGINQKLILYECSDDVKDHYYVLESTQKTLGSIQRHWIILSTQALDEIKRLTQVNLY